jgi:hypothetical protein
MITILKHPPVLAFSQKSAFIKFNTSLANNEKPDLKGMVQTENAVDGTPIDVQQARFHPTTREATVDIKSAFNFLKLPLPPDSTLSVTTNPFFTMPNSHALLKCRLWERYAESPYENAAVTSFNYNVIYGDTPVDYESNPSYYSLQHVAHRYPKGYRKTVTQQQPDFMFLKTPTGFSDCSVEVTVFMSNGQYYNIKLWEHFNIPNTDLVCFPSGFKQLDLFNRIKSAFPSYDVHPVSYVFAVFCNDTTYAPLPRFMIMQKSYILDNRVTENTVYVAYENGLGGIETQYFPISQKRRESEKEVSDLMLFDEADKREGEKVETQVKFWDRYTVKSLVLPRADLENMQRISHAPLWLCNDGIFERVYSDSKTVDAPPSHQNFGHFSFSYKRYL